MTSIESMGRLSLEAALPHGALTAHRSVMTHTMSERSNDLETIAATVSAWDQHFALLSSNPDGSLELRIESDPDGVRQFYIDRINEWLLITAYGENSVNGRWYRLVDSRGERHMVKRGEIDINRVAVMFPAWTDGIIGEMMWTEPEWAPQHLDKSLKMDLSRRLDAYEAAWRAGDVDGRLATVEETTCSVIRIVDVNSDRRSLMIARSKDELAAAWTSPASGRLLELERLNKITTNTYLFVSYRMVVELNGSPVERETGLILPIGMNNRFVGELVYSMEVAP
jgi:hypothetical protein